MRDSKRTIHTRGSSAPTPHWPFGISCKIPRAAVPSFCERLSYFALQKNGGAYFYPFYDEDKLGIAFEWYVPWKRKWFGFKVGVEVWVKNEDVHNLRGYILYGEDHPLRGQVPVLCQKEQSRFQHMVTRILDDALHPNPDRKRQFLIVTYLRLPEDQGFPGPVRLETHGFQLLSPVILPREHARVSAVVNIVKAQLKTEAEDQAFYATLKLAALLTLTTGKLYRMFHPSRSRLRLKRPLRALDPFPKPEDLFRESSWKAISGAGDERFGERLKTALDRHAALGSQEREEFDDAMFAYVSAKHISAEFPTLATVALVAACTIFRKKENCQGTVTCSVCGGLDPHEKVGERASIAQQLAEIFRLQENGQEHEQLNSLIKTVFREHRSKYVHDAITQHGEFSAAAGIRYVLPTADDAISEHLKAGDALTAFDSVVRRSLVAHLCSESGIPFDPTLFCFHALKFSTGKRKMAFFTVPANTVVALHV